MECRLGPTDSNHIPGNALMLMSQVHCVTHVPVHSPLRPVVVTVTHFRFRSTNEFHSALTRR